MLQRLNKYREARDWNFEGQWISNEFKWKSFGSKLGRVVVCCIVYYIWMERMLEFSNSSKAQVTLKICPTIIAFVSIWKIIKQKKANFSLCMN
ncbi:hypothetical protein LIER_07569 [Lithospermum erythrorhizon]|uniref:Uncharacterized protein n=1 Tax=Lithospermum erythrorhizon TaxID=34254 RepID=A0AAV3PDA6_LITER